MEKGWNMDKRIKELAEQAGFGSAYVNFGDLPKPLIRFAELVRADEREAWAKHIGSVDDPLAQLFANAIRARGNHEQN
jgi:hypothetical protein